MSASGQRRRVGVFDVLAVLTGRAPDILQRPLHKWPGKVLGFGTWVCSWLSCVEPGGDGFRECVCLG